MRERRDIVSLWRDSRAAVLATLVRVEGSSYRRAGARLLIADDGRYAGAISGGCLEADLIRKARWSVRNGAVVERFSTAFDDTADIPYGLGCGGTVDVLLEPSGTPEFAALMEALESSLHGARHHVRTWLPATGQPLRRVVDAVEGGQNELVEPGDEAEFVDEVLDPPQRLVVIGAGDDARPIVNFAALMGWEIAVVDGRPQLARAERFPAAHRVVVRADADSALLESGDAVIILTHSYEQDRAWLATALRCGTRYLGLLGSRHRSALLLSEAAAMLGWSVEDACQRVFAPIGLDLGGDGAEAVALAIVAEVQAVVQGKLGASQRMTPAVVAEQIAKGGASRYLQTLCAM